MSKSKTSPLLTASGLMQASPERVLFEGVSIGLNVGDKIGLIGHNGCGKSTFLKCLAQMTEPTEGVISTARSAVLASVEQHLPEALWSLSLRDAVRDALPEEKRDWMDWKVDVTLDDMGFEADHADVACADLSGGQMTRLMLARALMKEPNLLLLDEPSNHLDLPTVMWLEEFLRNWEGSFLLISHDTRLLDAVCNRTWVMEDRQLYSFDLPCTSALKTHEELKAARKARREAEEKEIRRVEASAKRIADWGRTFDNEDLSRKAKSMEKMADRMRENQTEQVEAYPWNLSIAGENIQADRLLKLTELTVTPQDVDLPLYTIEELVMRPGDRIAILGANGTGKSSLLGCCWRGRDAESGPVVLHPRGRMAFYDQTLQQLPGEASLVEAMVMLGKRLGADLLDRECEKTIISAGFSYPQLSQKVGALSGGERARLLLLTLSQVRPNLMMLDEPTNHLDIYGRAELTRQLRAFSGAFLLVSHDRQMVEDTCTRFWVVLNGKLQEAHDAQTAYALIEAQQPKKALASKPDAKTAPVPKAAETPGVVAAGDEDALLERLIELEGLFEADLARRPNRQSPHLHAKWKEEIEGLQITLGMTEER